MVVVGSAPLSVSPRSRAVKKLSYCILLLVMVCDVSQQAGLRLEERRRVGELMTAALIALLCMKASVKTAADVKQRIKLGSIQLNIADFALS